VSGVKVSLPKLLGIEALTFGPSSKRTGWHGRETTLVLKKIQEGRPSYSQTLYLKEEEVKAKSESNSGKGNARELSKLSLKDREHFSKELVRVDNVFYAHYLKVWVSAFYPELLKDRERELRKENELQGKDRKKINVPVYISDLVPLFSSRVILREMINSMKNDLGLRTILFAPSLDRIQALRERGDFGARGDEMVDKWRKSSVSIDRGEVGEPDDEHALAWDHPWHSKSDSDLKIAGKMKRDFYLDLSLPYIFYTLLDEARLSHRASFEDREALGHAYLGFTGGDSKAGKAPEVLRRLKKEISRELLSMKSSIEMAVPRTRTYLAKSLASELVDA
jgi:hypothetical protein